MQRRLNSEMGVNKPFENVSCQGRIQNFFQGWGINFCHFFKRIFPAELILKNLSAKNDSWGVLEHAPQEKILKISVLQWPFLVLSEQFLRKICHIFGR